MLPGIFIVEKALNFVDFIFKQSQANGRIFFEVLELLIVDFR